jgi:hypothetical protein
MIRAARRGSSLTRNPNAGTAPIRNEKDAICADWEKIALSRNLERLSSYCNEEDTIWPTDSDLSSIERRVIDILKLTRQRVMRSPFTNASPVWKAFQVLDKRTTLHLVQRVNSLVKRATERLSEAKEPSLITLSRQAREDPDARNLLHDINAVMNSPSAAGTIDWTRHESTLAQFSPTRSVELACNLGSAASLGVRCYARALELIVEYSPRKELRDKSLPLVMWLAGIGHPKAADLKRCDPDLAYAFERIVSGVKNAKSSRKRELGRQRIRRHRAKKFPAG